MPCDNRAFIKGLQFALCAVCFVYKVLTTWEAQRLSRFLQKRSREWAWASYTNSSSSASLFMDITFGAFAIITGASFIGRLAGDKKTVFETILMILGCLLFLVAGGLLLVSLDEVPHELFDNTIALAVLAFVTGVTLLLYGGHKKTKKDTAIKPTQTMTISQVVQTEDLIEKGKEERTQVKAAAEKPKDEEVTKPKENGIRNSDNGIRSVEIRIQDPKKMAGVAEELDGLAEAERTDAILQRSGGVMVGPRHVPNLQLSPIRHSSSFYLGGTKPTSTSYSWKVPT